MAQTKIRHKVIMAGIGGRGVLSAGLFLAQAAMSQYQYVLWFPSYQAAKRGGPCECSVVLSDHEIPSPIISKAEALLVIEPSQLRLFQDRVEPGGLIVVEQYGLIMGELRGDVRALVVPAVEMAVRLGDSQVSNLILLGSYVGATWVIPPRLIERELEERFGERQDVLSLNREAFGQGVKIGEEFTT